MMAQRSMPFVGYECEKLSCDADARVDDPTALARRQGDHWVQI
jgi:hypothetical protein